MGAAAADILFKVNDMVPEAPVVLAGSGPLLLLVACRLIDNGIEIGAMIETTRYRDYLKALPFLPQALLAASYLGKGLSMRWKIQKADFPIYLSADNLEIHGTDIAEEIHFTSWGRKQKIRAKSFLLHEGVVPNTQFTRLLECDHQWYERQRYWKPVLDNWGNTSVGGVSVAGDCGGIWGAKAAEKAGHLAAIDIVHRLEVISAQEKELAAGPFIKDLKQEKHIRPFLDQLFPPSRQSLVPTKDETLVCRCEEITAGQIREAVSLGAISPGQVKSYTRSGMGPCQGRMCGLTLAEIIADSRQVPTPTVGHLKIRPPLKPITIGQLADLEL
jgi:bacterioferritin-associated ferredoxin